MNRDPERQWSFYEKLTTALLSAAVLGIGTMFTTLQSHADRLTRLESGREADRLSVMATINERVDAKLDKVMDQIKALDKKLDQAMNDMRLHASKAGTASARVTNLYNFPTGGVKDHDYTLFTN